MASRQRSPIETEAIVAALDATYTLREAAEMLSCRVAGIKRAEVADNLVRGARLRQRYRWQQWRRAFQSPRAARLGLGSKRLEDAGQQRLFTADEAEGE